MVSSKKRNLTTNDFLQQILEGMFQNIEKLDEFNNDVINRLKELGRKDKFGQPGEIMEVLKNENSGN